MPYLLPHCEHRSFPVEVTTIDIYLRSSALYHIRSAALAAEVGYLTAAGRLMTLNLWLPIWIGLPIFVFGIPILFVNPDRSDQKYDVVSGIGDQSPVEQVSGDVELDGMLAPIDHSSHRADEYEFPKPKSLLDEIKNGLWEAWKYAGTSFQAAPVLEYVSSYTFWTRWRPMSCISYQNG